MEILESLLAGLRTVSGSFPDARRGATDYPMADLTMAAFSMFFMQSESFLGYQKRLEPGQNDSNCRTLFGIAKISTDNHIRTLLDGVAPDSLRPCFDQVLETLAAQDGLRDFQRLGGRLLVAPIRALVRNCGNQSFRCQGRGTSGIYREASVPKQNTGTGRPVRARKAGNAAGAKGADRALHPDSFQRMASAQL